MISLNASKETKYHPTNVPTLTPVANIWRFSIVFIERILKEPANETIAL
jgi:hypothetical protein